MKELFWFDWLDNFYYIDLYWSLTLMFTAIMISTGLIKGSMKRYQIILDNCECIRGSAWSVILLKFNINFT